MGKMKEKYYFPIATRVVDYCFDYFQLEDVNVDIELYSNYKFLKCWGDSEQISDTRYRIRICTDQSLRDFVATVCHEMVHVNQWVTNKWRGDGEKEAERLQYRMANKFWKEWK